MAIYGRQLILRNLGLINQRVALGHSQGLRYLSSSSDEEISKGETHTPGW